MSKKHGFKYNCAGQLKFLGVPYGDRDYVNNYMFEKLKLIFTKIDHIKLINNSFVKHNLLRKLYNYNKIIYALKVIDKYDEWMQELMKMHRLITKLILVGVNMNKTTNYQISLSQKRGGLGLRNPKLYKWAAELIAIEGKRDQICKFFTFLPYSYNYQQFRPISDEMFNILLKMGLTDMLSDFDLDMIDYWKGKCIKW